MEDDNIETNYEKPAKKKAKRTRKIKPLQRSWPDLRTVLLIGRNLQLPRKPMATIKVNSLAKSWLLFNLFAS
jgi:hypothetical protein